MELTPDSLNMIRHTNRFLVWAPKIHLIESFKSDMYHGAEEHKIKIGYTVKTSVFGDTNRDVSHYNFRLYLGDLLKKYLKDHIEPNVLKNYALMLSDCSCFGGSLYCNIEFFVIIADVRVYHEYENCIKMRLT